MTLHFKHTGTSIALLFLLTFFSFNYAFAQANFSKARHETLSQQDIDVTFSGSTVSFSGAPATTGWSVTVAATPVSITSIVLLNTTTVRLTFDAHLVAGHLAAEVFVKPGEAITVGYNGTGNLTAAGGVTVFAGQLSQNNWVFGCNDVKQLSQGKIAGKIIHQCIPVVMDFWAWQYNVSLRWMNSTNKAVNTFYNNIVWNDGSPATAVIPSRVDASLNPSATYIDPVGLGGSPAIIVSGTATHTFPSTTTGAAPKSCEWDVTVLPFANVPFVACPSQSQTTAFANYDTDNANTGTLQLPPLVAGTDNVCLGTNVGIQYNDNTLLNCRPAVETSLPNQADRYVRIVYGSQNNGGVGNIPDVFTTLPAALGGATVRITNNDGTGTLTNPSGYYPASVGSADNNGVINVPQPVTSPTGTSLIGTIFTTQTNNQVVNQKLWVRMDYWDICNPYNPASPNSPAPVSISAAITIIANNGAPTVAPLIFCANQANGTYNMTATTAGPSAGGTFKWYSDVTLTTLRLTGATYNPVSSPPNVSKNPAVLTTTNFYVTETIGNGCVSPATTAPFTVVPSVVAGTLSYAGSSPACTGYSPPAIGGTAATKGNGTFTYQWQNSPDNVTFTNIVGATGLNYTPPALATTTYYRRVDSSGPCASKNTNVITIQIDQVVAGGSIGSNQTICTGTVPATLTNTASPTGGNGTFTYQWQSSIVSAAGPFSNIIGATSATYASPALTQTTFFVRNASSGVCPGAQGTQPSNVITVTVNQVVNGGTANGSQAICSGSTPAPFTSGSAASGGDGATYTYLWQQSTVSNAGPWSSAVGANLGLTYAPPALTQTTFYQRLATSGVCSSQPSNVITVTVNPLPVASNPTGGGAVCAGNPAADIVWNFTTGTAPFSGTWTGTAGTYSGTYNFSQAGVTLLSTSVTLTTPITLNAGTYKLLTLVDANGCSAATLGGLTSATITIGGTPPTFTVAPSLTPIATCFNGASTTDPQLNFALDAGSASLANFILTYKIDASASRTKTFSTNAASQPTAAITFSDVELDAVGAHTLTVISIQSATGCLSVFNTPLTFTVNPLPVLVTPQNKTICSGATVNYEILLTPANTPAGTVFNWPAPTVSAGPAQGTAGVNVAADPAGTLHLKDVLTNTTGAPITVTYAVTPTSSLGCAGTPQNVVITVNPAPVITAGQIKTICSGSAVNLEVLETPANTPAGTLFNWPLPVVSAGPAQGTAGVNVAADPLGKKHLADVLTNTTGANITVTYHITPTSSLGCAGAQVPVVITVEPAPVIVAGQIKTICSGSAVNLEVLETPANAPAGTLFNWAIPTVSAGPAQGTAGVNVPADPAGTKHLTDVLTNVTGANITVTYKITPTSSAGCLGTQVPVVITVEPAPKIISGQTKTICSGQNVNYEVLLSPLNAPTGTVFNWPTPTVSAGPAQGTAGVNVAMGAAGTKHITEVLTNTTSSPITVTYAVTPTSGAGCVGAPQNVVITVNPLPINNPIQGNTSVCTGNSIILYQLDPTFNPGSTYTWSVVGTPPADVTLFGGGGTNSANFFVLLKFPAATGTVALNVFEALSGCNGPTSSMTVTVNSAPAPNTIDGVTQVCTNQTLVPYNVHTPNGSSTYSWVVTGATPSGSGSTINVDFGIITPVTIQVTETASSGCVGAPASTNVTVNSRPLMTSGSTTTVCSAVAPGLAFSSSLPSTYAWSVVSITGGVTGATVGQVGTGNLSSTFTGAGALRNTSGAVGSVTFNVTPTATAAPNCQGTTQSVVVTVNPEPVLVNPQTKTICSGQQINYEILTTPANLPASNVFSWAVPTMSDASIQGTSGTNVPAGPAGTLHITDMLVNTSGSPITATYTISATSGAGCSSTQPASSRKVIITVNPAPIMTSTNAQSVCSGATPPLVFTSNVASNYAWTVTNITGTVSGVANGQAGSGNLSLTFAGAGAIKNTSTSNSSVTFSVVPTSTTGSGCIGAPQLVTLTIIPEPLMTSSPSLNICSGQSPPLIFASTISATYNWTVASILGTLTGINNGQNGTGNLSTTFGAGVIKNVSGASATVVFTVTPVSTAAGSCAGAPPQTVTMTVYPEPVMTSLNNNTICSGAAPTLVFSANLASTFAWTVSGISGTVSGVTNGQSGTGDLSVTFTGASAISNTSGASASVMFSVTPTSSTGTSCIGAPQTVTLSVNPQPQMTSSNADAICSGATPALNFTSDVASSYTWKVTNILGTMSGVVIGQSGSGNLSATFNAGAAIRNTTVSPGKVTFDVTPTSTTGSGCVGTPQTVTLTVNPEPVMTSPTNPLPFCSGGAPPLTFTSSVPSAYNWIVTGITGTLSNVSIGQAGLGNLSLTFTGAAAITNTSGSLGSVTFNVTPTSTSGSCVGAAQSVTISINPQPVMTSPNIAAICSGQTPTLTFTSSIASTYTWQVSTITGTVTGVSILQTGSGDLSSTFSGGSAIKNTSTGSATVKFLVTPTSATGSGCVGSAQLVTLTVNPEPVMTSITNPSVCSGESPTGFTFTSSIAATYNWSVTNITGTLSGVSLLQSGMGDLSSTFIVGSAIRNISASDGIVTFNVVPTAGGCAGATQVVHLTVNPEPTGSDFSQPGCVNATPLNHNIQSQVSNVLSVFTYTVSSDNAGVPAGPNRIIASNSAITDSYNNTTGTVATITYLITPFSSGHNCAGGTFKYIVTVSPVPVGSGIPAPPDLCSRSPINLTTQSFITNGVTSSFTWTATYDPGLTGGVGSGNGNITDVLTNTTGGVLKAKYQVQASASGCLGTPFTIIQKVNPEPVMTASLTTPFPICSTNSASSNPITAVILSVSNAVPAQYNVVLKSQDSGVTGTPTTGNGLVAAALSSDKFGNTTSAQLKVVYTVTPVATMGSCLGAPIDITIQVNPEPVLFSSGVPQVCSTNSSNPANPINVVLTTNGTSAPVGSSGFKLIAAEQYSTGGPFTTTLPSGFTIVSATPNGSTGDLNLIKQDTYKNTSNVSVTVRYSIQATSASGGCLSVPLNYDVIINPEPILSPGSVVICSGAAPGASITLSAAGGSIAIAQYNLKQVLVQAGLTPNGSNAGLGVYNTGTFLGSDIFTNTTSGQLQTTYNIAPITAAGCVGADQNVILKVNPSPAVSTGLNAIVCSGGASGITLATTPSSAAARATLGYFVTNIVQSVAAPQLQPFGSNVGTNTTTGVNTNYIIGDKFVNNTNVVQTVTYSVQAITAALCTGPVQDVVLTIEPTIIATPTPLIGSMCSNGVTNITLNSPSVPSAGPISFSYLASSSIGGQLSGFIPSVSNLPSGAIIADKLLNISSGSGDVTYSVTPIANGAKNGSGCSGSPVQVVVHVDPIPKLTPSPSIQTICEGVASNIVLTTTTVPSAGGTVQFNVVSVAPDPGLSSATASGPYTNGQSIADVWSNTNTFMSTAIYTLQPVVSGGLACAGSPVTIALNVNPSPNVTPTIINPTLGPAAICSNDLVNISLASDVSNTLNSWSASVTAGTAKGFSGGSGDLIFQTLRNAGFVPATVRYHVTPKASGCTGPAVDVDIKVDPIPDILLTAPAAVCYGGTLNVPLTSSVAGTNFNWIVDPNNSGVNTTPASGAAINYVVKDTLTSAEDFLTFTISGVGPGATACPSVQRSLTVVASPHMNGKFLNDNTSFCEGRKDFLQIQLDGQAPFTMSYTDGTNNFTLTKLGNFKSIPVKPTNSTTYQLISMKDANGCSITLNSQVVYTVYSNVAAGFEIGPIPKFVGGNATVTFTNTSAPLNATQYTYNWAFGENASPDSVSGAGPYAVNYSLPGRKTVTLVAYNNAAQTGGLSCSSSITKTFNILLDPLVAEFKVDPKRACYPTKITVIENLSTGDLFKWSVIDAQSRDTVASSNAPFPIFSISNDGSYIVRLLTSSSFTGQTAIDTAHVVLYPKPEPIFDAFPLTVYIPDQEVTTINGSGNTANQYLWDFGDGGTSTDYQPTHKYRIEGVDSLKFTAQYDHGGGVICSATHYKIVVAKQGGVAKIPNAFTPSTAGPSGGVGGVDLYNYVFLPQVKGVEEFNMQIYDRWGNLIFESNNQTVGWDGYDAHGRLMPSGVYVYKLTLRLSDQQRTTQVGDVTLIR